MDIFRLQKKGFYSPFFIQSYKICPLPIEKKGLFLGRP